MSSSCPPVWTVAVTGVTGNERVKGSLGVGKSLLCNRFIRGHHDDFYLDHSSTLSQTDFSGSPVINNDHWLYWGERILDADSSSGQTTLVRVIEQTEFVDDETFEPIAGPSYEPYEKRCGRVRLESRDKLMYIRQEQLGTEADFPQRILPDGKTNVDSFVFVFDCSTVARRNYEKHIDYASTVLNHLLKSKRSVVIAASKFDAADESGRQALNRLVARKSFRDIPIVQVSAVCNVNVDELFAICIRPKSRLRVRPYEIAVKNVDVANRETRSAYTSLLHALVSTDGWPSQRTPWSRLVGEMGMSRNPSFLEFLRVFGMGAARATFESHVQEVREKCMKTRLRALLPSLSSAFNSLLDPTESVHLEWIQARGRIYEHALFDTFFLPLGTLGRLLEPVSSDEDLSRPDARFPAEILLRPEARQEYDSWRNSIGNEMRRVKLEEETERFLVACPQVTPGRPLAEVRMLLAGSTSIIDALTPAQLAIVYDRYQGDLISRSESELAECLLEHIDIFVEVIVSKREFTNPTVSTPVVLSNNDMDHLRTVLQEDLRYRQLSGVRERREWMVREWAAFLSLPFSCRCPALMKCIDVLAHDTVQAFIQRRRQLMEGEEMERMEMVIYGQEALSRMFCIEMHRSQMEGRLQLPQPAMQLMCREGRVEEGLEGATMRLFLVQSQNTLTKYREALKMEDLANGSPPSLFLIACPEEDYHLIPLLQHDTCSLAESVQGYVVTPGKGGSSSGSVESPSPFPPSYLLAVMENGMEIVENRRGFIRAQMSMMCGEGCNPESLLTSLLSPPFFRLLSYRSNIDSVPLIPLLTQKGNLRVDLRLSSYHSWLCMRPRLPIHAHIVVYSAKRCASWAHARVGVRRILEEGDGSLTGKAILIVAIANDVTDYFRDEETNVLLTEGSELATSVGAQFVSIGENGGGGGGMGSGCASQLSAFFDRIALMMPPSGRRSGNCTMQRQKSVRSLESEYGSVRRLVGEVASRQVKEASTRETSETMAAAAADETKTAAPTAQRRRPAPPRLLFNRYSMLSSSSIPSSSPSLPSLHSIAPLATPEPLDLAAEYSTVQDSGSSEDDYAHIGTEVVEKKYSATSEETTSKYIRRSKMLLSSPPSSSTSSPPSSASSVLRKSTAPPILSTPSLGSLGYHKMSTPSCLHLLGTSLVSPSMSVSVHGGSTTSKSDFSPSSALSALSSGPSSLSTHPLSVRSLTMDVINMDSVAAARVKVGIVGGQRGQRHGMRKSISVESLTGDIDKKKSSFVRKIKSSFRRRPRDSSVGGIEGGGGGRREGEGGASLPHSPALGAVRRLEHKKNTTLPIVTMTAATPPSGSCSTEKSWASAGFSWLAGRSPHRRRKERAATSGLERESSPPSAPLATLIVEGSHPPVPRFVTNAVQLIEKEGGLSAEGLYRLSGSRSQQEELEQRLSLSNSSYSSPVDVYSVAVALKNFFLRLPEPVIPRELQGDLLDANDISSMRSILGSLPVHNRNVLVYLLAHLDKVAESSPTAMTHANLAIVWLPALIQPQFKDLEHLTSGVDSYKKTVRTLLENWRLILPLDNTLLRSF